MPRYSTIKAICRPPHWCLRADGPSGLGLVAVPFLNQVATPTKATVTTAVSTSVDPALWCLVTGAELGCSFGSDRLESSWKGNILRSRNQGPNLPKTLPRATEHNQGRRAGTSHLRKRTPTWEQGWTIGARAAQGYPLLTRPARWHFTASSFSTQVPLI